MKKMILALALALATGFVLVGPASAGKIQLYNRCPVSSPALRVPTFGTDTNQTVTNPVHLGFGWAAQKPQQVQQFLAAQYATTISITTDPLGLNEVYPLEQSWGQGGGSYWGPITAITGTNNAGNPVPLYASNYITPDFTLPDGQYYLSLDLRLVTGVNDGENAARPGSWLTITSCSFTVTG
jgi:hypothetical protein